MSTVASTRGGNESMLSDLGGGRLGLVRKS